MSTFSKKSISRMGNDHFPYGKWKYVNFIQKKIHFPYGKWISISCKYYWSTSGLQNKCKWRRRETTLHLSLHATKFTLRLNLPKYWPKIELNHSGLFLPKTIEKFKKKIFFSLNSTVSEDSIHSLYCKLRQTQAC